MSTSTRTFSFSHSTRILLLALVFVLFTHRPLPTGGEDVSIALADGDPFTFATVIDEARTLAAEPYKEPARIYPQLLGIDYDAWRDIRFKPEKALWNKSNIPFQIQFFHPGYFYDRQVSVTEVANGVSSPVKLGKDCFTYGRNEALADGLPENLLPAGFRVHGPINKPDYFDEYLVFLGMSYFRAVQKGGRYGLSARGLAVDTASSGGEEFPWFKKFWIARPAHGDKKIVIYGLLDSPSLTGAYSFSVRPGEATVMDVKSRLFFREPVAKPGIAPLTSMFFYGEESGSAKDYRPEVHDSDGLLVAFGSGEWLWRPLKNPSSLQISDFRTQGVRGFGLLQRDTDFNDYQDLETRYELRPSVWVEPAGDWGPGRVELVEIPTNNEIHDNIVAYFVPDVIPEPGSEFSFDYSMRWHRADARGSKWGVTAATRQFSGDGENSRTFLIDFVGGKLAGLAPDSGVEGVVSVNPGGRVEETQTFKNDVTGGWRLVFRVILDQSSTLERVLAEKKRPVELRAFLRLDKETLTETWSYALVP